MHFWALFPKKRTVIALKGFLKSSIVNMGELIRNVPLNTVRFWALFPKMRIFGRFFLMASCLSFSSPYAFLYSRTITFNDTQGH